VLARPGITGTIWPTLNREESAALTRSAEVIVEAAGG
jgi:hypothetical protein